MRKVAINKLYNTITCIKEQPNVIKKQPNCGIVAGCLLENSELTPPLLTCEQDCESKLKLQYSLAENVPSK
jgi:hypothetical protein